MVTSTSNSVDSVPDSIQASTLSTDTAGACFGRLAHPNLNSQKNLRNAKIALTRAIYACIVESTTALRQAEEQPQKRRGPGEQNLAPLDKGRQMNRGSDCFEGGRLRADRLHPLIAAPLVAVMCLAQLLVIDGIQEHRLAATPEVVVELDVAKAQPLRVVSENAIGSAPTAARLFR
jgi:hypothetical protein